jgi:hypothetical protein
MARPSSPPLAIPLALVALILAIAPAPAQASIYSQVLRTYEATGSVAPCQFTSAQLESALKGIDTYGAQYFQDFSSAVQAALTARAGGACTPHPAAAAAPAPGPGPPIRPGPIGASTSAGIPAPILILAVLAGVFAVVGVLTGAARCYGWRPPWAAAWQHACAEAELRAQGTWSELGDRLRRGPRRAQRR